VNLSIPASLHERSLPEPVLRAAESFIERDDRRLEARAKLVIELSRLSVAIDDGGPFGAAIFDERGALVSVGINRVVPWASYEFHAEVVALALAKHRAPEGFLLPADWSLVSSSAPCCMCFGRFFWSGLRHLTVCARREDVERIVGFDEGPIPEAWQDTLRQRGFMVTEDVERERACDALAAYRGPLYQRPSSLR
jgi:tRNA(Arg) A34 adenosine deaminase TadA